MRRIVYWGNCQMQALHNLHRQFVAPTTGDILAWVNPWEAVSDKQLAEIAAADLVVGMVIVSPP